jgi:hypothetical protein
MMAANDSSGVITPLPSVPSVPGSVVAPSATPLPIPNGAQRTSPPAVSKSSAQPLESTVADTQSHSVSTATHHSTSTLHSTSSLPTVSDVIADTTPFTLKRSDHRGKKAALSTSTRSVPAPVSPRSTPASPAPFPTSPSRFIALDDDDDNDDLMDPSSHSDTEHSAPRPASPDDVCMETARDHPVTPSTSKPNAFAAMMDASAGRKRKGVAMQPPPSSPPSTSSSSTSPSSSSSSSSSPSPSSSPAHAATPKASSSSASTPVQPAKRSRGTPKAASVSPPREEFIRPPAPNPTEEDEAPAKPKKGGRPVGSGGPSKAVILEMLDERESEVATMRQTIASLTAQLASRSPTAPPAAAASAPAPTLVPASHPSQAPVSAPASPAPQAVPMNPPCSPPAQALPAPPAATSAPSAPAPTSAPKASPKPAASAAPPKTASTLRHPPLPGDQRARPPQSVVLNLGLPMTSRKDLTLSIAFPANIRGRFTGDRLPRHSNNDSKLVYAIGTVLTKGLGIPAPRILKALSQYDHPLDLSVALDGLWSSAPTSGPRSAPQRTSYLRDLDTAAHRWTESEDPDDIGPALLSTPSDEPAHACHDQWHDVLNPATDVLASSTTPQGTRHVLRLAFNSPLVASAVRTHILRYTAWLLPPGTSHTAAVLAGMDPWLRTWAIAAERANAIHTVASIDVYGMRYETTLLSGWTRGPDHQPTSSEGVDYHQLYGDENRLYAYLREVAPNCSACRPTTLADGTGNIQFVHEAQHRNELYRLQGITSPRNGITRPLKLTFQQLRRPLAQCCSVCGHPGHTARTCSLHEHRSASKSTSTSAGVAISQAEDEGKMEVDEASLPFGSVVCRHCYSPGHRETCFTPPSLQTCRLCDATGHTSFRCPRYKATWVPLSAPPSTRPPNPRPLLLVANQRGTSWSSVAAGNARPPTSHLPTPHLADPSAFPALPGGVPASPTDSAASSHRSAPASPASPVSPAPQAQPGIAELTAAVTSMQTTLQATVAAMQASFYQSLLALQTSMLATMQTALEATHHRFEQRLADLPSFPGHLKYLPAPILPSDLPTPTGTVTAAAALLPPCTPTYMQSGDQKDSAPPSDTASASASPALLPPPSGGNAFYSGSSMNGAFANIGFHQSKAVSTLNAAPKLPAAAHPPAYPSPSATASSLPSHQ